MFPAQHCPGFEQLKQLKSFTCNCPECGAENEIFSDELNKAHNCIKCGKPIDCTKCRMAGTGKTDTPR